MLTRIEIKGYRSLRDVNLEMKGLNVLIGPNNSGKSNFLDVFALMSDAAYGKLEEGIAKRGGITALTFRNDRICLNFKAYIPRSRVKNAKPEQDIIYNIELASFLGQRLIVDETLAKINGNEKINLVYRKNSEPVYLLEKKDSKEEVSIELETMELALTQLNAIPLSETGTLARNTLSFFSKLILYRPFLVGIDSQIRLPQVTRSGFRLFQDGSNLVSILHAIQSQHPAVWDEITSILKNLYPDFRFITFPPEGGDGKLLMRWWEHPFEKEYGFSVNLLSDGVLRMLCLIAILKSPDPPPLICIDEPEIGLHPQWIKVIAELLESAATRTQIIVSTHSPELVSYVKPEHVVVVEKHDGETTLERLDADELSSWLEKFRLGDLWLAGQIGG